MRDEKEAEIAMTSAPLSRQIAGNGAPVCSLRLLHLRAAMFASTNHRDTPASPEVHRSSLVSMWGPALAGPGRPEGRPLRILNTSELRSSFGLHRPACRV